MSLSLHILIVNLNNLEFTRSCINDLLNQDTKDFKITLIDQNSSETGTQEFLNTLNSKGINVVLNVSNRPLNHVWNEFAANSTEDLLCFLNNDVVINSNFVSHLIEVFQCEPTVGIAVHSTNHPSFSAIHDKLIYRVVEPFKFMQGWDFTIRRDLYKPVPESIKIYCGDDYIFHNVYEQGYNLAYILSSPMIHLEGQSKKFMSTSGIEDIEEFKRLGFEHYLKVNFKYSRIKPTFKKLGKANFWDKLMIRFK